MLAVFLCLVSSLCLFVISASAAEESVSVEYSFYNDVKLPNLPDYDSESKPYAIVTYYPNRDKYYLTVSNLPFVYGYYGSSDMVYAKDESLLYTRYELLSGGSEWDFVQDASAEIGCPPSSPLVWSNHDVIAIETDSVYFAGSDPIPFVDNSGSDAVSSDLLINEVEFVFLPVLSWVGDVAEQIVSNPMLLLFCVAVPLCGIGVGMFKRLLHSRG